MPTPPYDFTFKKASLADDAIPTILAPPDPSRIFVLPAFAPNGDYLAAVDLKGSFYDASNVATSGQYYAQLWLKIVGDVPAWAAFGNIVASIHEGETASLPFGSLLQTIGGIPTFLGDVQAFVQITTITSATGARMVFQGNLNADPPVLRSLSGAAITPLPAGAATQTTLAAVLAKLSADPASQTTLAAVLAAVTPPSAALLGADWGANVTKNVAVGSTVPTGFYGKNRNASTRWIQLHNTATVPGAGRVPEISIEVPSGAIALIDEQLIGPKNTQFPLGIAYAWSTTSGTYTAATAGDGDTQVWGHPA